MGKTIFLGLLLVLVTGIAMTTSFVYPSSIVESAVEKISSTLSKESSEDDLDKSKDSLESVEDQEQMLCNVIVRAAHDLHVYQSKSANEIITYLNTDCKNLAVDELIEQCQEILAQHGTKIYEYVTNGMEMSQVCQKIEEGTALNLDDGKSIDCAQKGGNKCQCCKMHVEKRKIRLRYIVKQMAKKRLCMCKRSPRPQRCRQWIRHEERRQLKRIEKICPYIVCKHLGYCDKSTEDHVPNTLLTQSKSDTVIDAPSIWLGLLDRELEAHITKDVCGEFKELQLLCVHLAASVDSSRYVKIYMAVLQNDTKWIDDGFRKEAQSVQAGINVDLCGACKNAVQSSTTFSLQILETVRNALNNTCEQCPVRKECIEFFEKQFDTISTYLHSLKANQLCSSVHLCSSTVLSPVNNDEKCAACVQRLQPRKDAATQAVNRLSIHFTDLCAKLDIPECPEFVSEMAIQAHSFINDFNVQETCLAMGFCEQNTARDLDDYERAFVEEISQQVCSTLGPFETLCQQVVQGNSKQVQTVNLNVTDISDFSRQCEEKGDDKSDIAATNDQCSQGKDKCQCCIHRVIEKKKCFKKRVAKYVWHMLHLCRRCPAREKCEQYWQKKKACWDAKIDKICPKKACIRMGYCKKTDLSSICAYMGPFEQVCEQTLNTVGQSFSVLLNPATVQPNNDNEKQSGANKP